MQTPSNVISVFQITEIHLFEILNALLVSKYYVAKQAKEYICCGSILSFV